MAAHDRTDWLESRMAVMESALSAMFEAAGIPADDIQQWRTWAMTAGIGDTTRLHGAMNKIVAELRARSANRPETQAATPRRGPGTMTSMCGRARLSTDFHQIRIQINLSPDAPSLNLRPSWNIAPTQDMLIVAHRAGVGRTARLAKWGLIPGWAKEPKPMGATFNARSEEMRDKPTYRNAWKAGRRCLIVVDGFYEWRKDDKQPFTIARADKSLMVMGGLWERWPSKPIEGQEEVYTCTVITQKAGPEMASLHDREPLILPKSAWPVWLGEEPGDVDALIRPCDVNELIHWPVIKDVGNVRNNGPALIERVGK